jgi:hypothetical protein
MQIENLFLFGFNMWQGISKKQFADKLNGCTK